MFYSKDKINYCFYLCKIVYIEFCVLLGYKYLIRGMFFLALYVATLFFAFMWPINVYV